MCLWWWPWRRSRSPTRGGGQHSLVMAVCTKWQTRYIAHSQGRAQARAILDVDTGKQEKQLAWLECFSSSFVYKFWAIFTFSSPVGKVAMLNTSVYKKWETLWPPHVGEGPRTLNFLADGVCLVAPAWRTIGRRMLPQGQLHLNWLYIPPLKHAENHNLPNRAQMRTLKYWDE